MRTLFSRYRFVAVLLLLLLPAAPVSASDADAKVVGDFLAAWHTNDVDKIMSFVAEDCHYENVPSLTGDNPVIKGRAAMRAFLAPFFVKDPLTVPFKFHTEVKMTVVGDGAVASERVDYFEVGNSTFALPVAGFFKVKDGKITYWVDYFDGPSIEPVSLIMKTFAKKK